VPAIRLSGVADPSAVPNQPVREHRPVLLGEQRTHFRLDLVWVGLGGPAEASGQPAKVRVHGDSRDVEGISKHDVRGLPPHAGQRDQVVEAARHRSVVPLHQCFAQPDHRTSLRAKEPQGSDDLLKLARIGRSERGCVGVVREQRGRSYVDPFVRALRSQNGRDQQFEGVVEVQFAVGVGIGLGEDAVDLAGAPNQRSWRLASWRRVCCGELKTARRAFGWHVSKGITNGSRRGSVCGVIDYAETTGVVGRPLTPQVVFVTLITAPTAGWAPRHVAASATPTTLIVFLNHQVRIYGWMTPPRQ